MVKIISMLTNNDLTVENAREMFEASNHAPTQYWGFKDKVADHLRSRGLRSVEIATPYHSNWLDNTKARLLLGWRPQIDLRQLIDSAWDYARAPDDPRTVLYPG